MTDSTNERWLVNGTSLSQFCWAVKTFGGSPRGLPVMRGQNIGVAYIPGQLFRSKFPDSRTISLLMWTAGISPTTSQPNTSDPHLQFSDNFRTLQKLFYTPGAQVSLTREWRQTVGTPTIISATALAEIASDAQPTMTGTGRADLSVDFVLADPYFYSNLTMNTTVPYNASSTVLNAGDDIVAYKNFTLNFHGPLFYPRLTNTTNSAFIQLNTVIGSGDSILVDMGAYTAVRASDNSDMRGVVSHGGTKRWISIATGTNFFLLSSSASTDTGTVDFSYQVPYV